MEFLRKINWYKLFLVALFIALLVIVDEKSKEQQKLLKKIAEIETEAEAEAKTETETEAEANSLMQTSEVINNGISDLMFNVTDASGVELQAEFNIYDNEKNLIYSNYPVRKKFPFKAGTYYYSIASVPTGFVQESTIFQFEITGKDIVQTMHIVLEKGYTLSYTTNIPHLTIGIYNSNSVLIDKLQLNDGKTTSIVLPQGTYYYCIVSAPVDAKIKLNEFSKLDLNKNLNIMLN